MTEIVDKEEGDAQVSAAEEHTSEPERVEKGRANKAEKPTLRTSQGAQVRGYLESIVDSDFVRELQQALSHAHQLTGDDWRVEIRAGDIQIVCEHALDEVDVSLDSVLDLARASVGESGDRAAQPARIKLPVPVPQRSKSKK